MNLTKYIECITALNTTAILFQHGNHYSQYGVPANATDGRLGMPELQKCLHMSMNPDGNWAMDTWRLQYVPRAEVSLDNMLYCTGDIDLSELTKDGLGLGFDDIASDYESSADDEEGYQHNNDDSAFTNNTSARQTNHSNPATDGRPGPGISIDEYNPNNPPATVQRNLHINLFQHAFSGVCNQDSHGKGTEWTGD